MLARMRSHPILFVGVAFPLLVGLVVAWPAWADVVMPPPTDCPEGTTPSTGHNGPFCRPSPPESCPEGHVPMVYLDKAFCEPPPPEVCPPGSIWTSRGPDELFCQGGRVCGEYPCPDGHTCVESSLCVRQERQFRMMYEVASKVCEGDGDCDEGEACVTNKRCEPVEKRQPVASTETDEPAAGETPTADEAPAEPQEPAPAPEAAPVEADEDEVPSKGCAVSSGSPSILSTAGLAGLILILGLRRR